MPIIVPCACGAQLKARDSLAGRRGKCPTCGAVLAIPIPPPALDDEEGRVEHAMAEVPGPAPTSSPPTYQTSGGVLVSTSGVPLGRPGPEPVGASGSPFREYLYLILIATLAPLASLLLLEGDDVEARFERTVVKHIDRLGDSISDEGIDLPRDEFLARLPDRRIEGAHLPYNTMWHWAYAMTATLGFFGLLLALFPGAAVAPSKLILTGLFTGTIGIFFLLATQLVAGFAQGIPIRGRGLVMALILLLKFITFSYNAALNPENGFWPSFFGFTFGVGLCEEACKALPLFRYHDADRRANWRAYVLLGLASGVGFGVSEGVKYSGDTYNGIHTAGVYVVRFVSCVSLHAIWSASVGAALARSEALLREMEAGETLANSLKIVGVPMILHGLYDTALKREMNVEALAVAGLSFAWLCWQVESARFREPRREASERAEWA